MNVLDTKNLTQWNSFKYSSLHKKWIFLPLRISLENFIFCAVLVHSDTSLCNITNLVCKMLTTWTLLLSFKSVILGKYQEWEQKFGHTCLSIESRLRTRFHNNGYHTIHEVDVALFIALEVVPITLKMPYQ